MQIEAKREENLISGIWKFSDRMSVETVAATAKELIAAAKPDAYKSIQIRRCSKNQYGLCFVYDCGESARNKSTYDRFFDPITDKLKRQFGNDFVGWDVTNEVWAVK